MARKIPFIVGIIPFFFLFLFAFLSWYWLMGNLFYSKMYAEGIAAGYSLPVIFVLTAYISSKMKGKKFAALSHFISLIILAIIYAALASSVPQAGVELFSPQAVVGISFISAIMSIMLYPIVELEHYFAYKTLLFIAGVIFMPLFIVIATFGLTVSTPILAELKGSSTEVIIEALQTPAYVLITALLGFWASAVWLGLSKTQGKFIPGVEIKPMMPFRPDMILPGGVNFVKGVILVGMGTILMIHLPTALPKWDWWGFVLAFWGIMLLIPIRGIFKMLMRRERLLGELKPNDLTVNITKEILLFGGLLVLLYGFLNAFRGVIPFTELIPTSINALSALFLISSFIILVPLRIWLKGKLLEGTETFVQLLAKQFLLLVGVVLLFLFMGSLFQQQLHVNPLSLNYATNPLDFSLGFVLFILGSILIFLVRPVALRNEFKAMLKIMPGMLSTLSEEKRREVMEKRLKTLANYTSGQRYEHMKPMMEGLNALPKNSRMTVRKSMMESLAKLSAKKRQLIMKTMDEILF